VDQHLLNDLLELKQRDIDTRNLLLRKNKLYGDYALEMQQVHIENAQKLDQIVSEHGWPDMTKVGKEGCRAAWLIAQHAICTPALQRKFLDQLIQAAERGTVPRVQVAYLTDRIRFNEGRPQVYGTVLDWDESGELSCEVEDPDTLDIRRQEIGLAPFQQDLEKHRQEVSAEGGKPPKNFNHYKQKVRAWARSVGWQ